MVTVRLALPRSRTKKAGGAGGTPLSGAPGSLTRYVFHRPVARAAQEAPIRKAMPLVALCRMPAIEECAPLCRDDTWSH